MKEQNMEEVDIDFKHTVDIVAKRYIKYIVLTTAGLFVCVFACFGVIFTQNLSWLGLFIPAFIYSVVISFFMFQSRKKFYQQAETVPVSKQTKEVH